MNIALRYTLASLPILIGFCIGAFSGLGTIVAFLVPFVGGLISGHLLARVWINQRYPL